MTFLEKLHHPEYYIKTFLKWSILSLLVGVVGGLLGAAFHHVLHFVTHIRGEHNWLIFLLPIGGLLTVAIYMLLGVRRNRGTNEVIDAVIQNQPVSPMVAPAVFLASAVTHLFGGSAGREGAALQIGASVASKLGKLLGQRILTNKRSNLILAHAAIGNRIALGSLKIGSHALIDQP